MSSGLVPGGESAIPYFGASSWMRAPVARTVISALPYQIEFSSAGRVERAAGETSDGVGIAKDSLTQYRGLVPAPDLKIQFQKSRSRDRVLAVRLDFTESERGIQTVSIGLLRQGIQAHAAIAEYAGLFHDRERETPP